MFNCWAAAKADEGGGVIGDDAQALCALQPNECQKQPNACMHQDMQPP